jgi:hypothetical protein
MEQRWNSAVCKEPEMAEEKTQTSEGEPKKPSEEIIMLKGAPVKRLRGEGGKFQRQPKALPSSREFTRVTRNYMLQMEVGKDGKMTKGSQSKYEMMVENLMCIARGVKTVLKNGDTVEREPKADMAAAQAFKVVTERGLGQPPKGDEELDAMKTQTVRVVLIQPPAEMMNKLVREDKPRAELKPAFLEGEFVTNKEIS